MRLLTSNIRYNYFLLVYVLFFRYCCAGNYDKYCNKTKIKQEKLKMAEEKLTCVASKHLFNFKLNGVIPDDVVANENKWCDKPETKKITKLWDRMEELEPKNDPKSIQEYVEVYRQSSELEWGELGKHPAFDEAKDNCMITTIKVPTFHDGIHDVPVQIYTPKNINRNKSNAALIYAHGGGAIAMTAEIYKPWLLLLSYHANIVLFNVDYRLAPETKCPNNAKDFYEAVKYISNNSETLNIDSKRLAISGDSGGGYICLATMLLIAYDYDTNGEIVKLAIPEIPMCSDYCFSEIKSMTKEEREVAKSMRKNWKMIAEDWEKQRNDPLLFPDKTKVKDLMRMPPTVMITGEFDIFITEATRMANKLRAAGRLLELVIFPGMTHSSNWYPDNEGFKTRLEALKLIIDEYLIK
jgi:acetyl esterase